MSEQKPKHVYPDKYPPGSHWSITEAWEILDTVNPGVIPPHIRAYLAGRIAGRLMAVAEQSPEDKP